MPLSAMVQQSNDALSSASTIKLVQEHPEIVEMLGIRGKLADAAEELLHVDPEGIAYLRAMPGPVQESMRAAIFDAITGREGQEPKPVQISFMPAYDYEVRVSDYGQAVSVQVRGPYTMGSPREKSAYA